MADREWMDVYRHCVWGNWFRCHNRALAGKRPWCHCHVARVGRARRAANRMIADGLPAGCETFQVPVQPGAEDFCRDGLTYRRKLLTFVLNRDGLWQEVLD